MNLLTMRVSAIMCLYGLTTALAQNLPNAPATSPAGQQQPARSAPGVIQGVEFPGLSRVPLDTMSATILSKVGDLYNEETIRHDLVALWGTARFDDIQLRTETGSQGGVIVRFVMTERQDQTLPALASSVIERIEYRGISHVPAEIVRAAVLSKAGDLYNEETLRRDFMALWNTKRFEDIQVRKETGDKGGIVVRFVVIERP